MTRVPLTQPSTDLVEVTLDLILLIDQLLMVLRQRGSVLDLASLRLQWDDLRFEASREAESVKSEIDHVVAEAQAWIPGQNGPDRHDKRGGLRHHASVSRRLNASSNSSLSDAAASAATTPVTPSPSLNNLPPSPGNEASPPRKGSASPSKVVGPKSALHLSILRSQLIGLQTRHRNFSYTLVKRSSGILDRMIDSAGRLKGLGSTDGPHEDKEGSGGAVPEELIDIQESIENQTRDIGQRVIWCGQFEDQCRQAHQHFMASTQAQAAADDVLGEIEKALGEPASSTRHATLAKLYKDATVALPPAVDATFPHPSHPDYPSKDEHNAVILDTIKATRHGAQARLDLAGHALAFYASLLKAREALLAQQKRVQTVRRQLVEAMDRLEHGTVHAPRPSVGAVADQGGECTHWLQNIHGWLSEGDEVVRSATDIHQSTMLCVMQYCKSLVSAPMAVKPLLPIYGLPDDLRHVVADDAGDLVAHAQRCAELTRLTRTDAEVLPLVVCIRQDYQDLTEDVESLSGDIVRAVNQAAWSPQAPESQHIHFEYQMAKISDRVQAANDDLERLKDVVGSQSQAFTRLTADASHIRDGIAESQRTLDVLALVVGQAETVRTVQCTAQGFLASIDAIHQTMADEQQATAGSITQLKNEINEWSNGLVRQVTFISEQPPLLGSGPLDRGEVPLTPPLTPVNDASPDTSTMPDFSTLDIRVRNEVNHQSTRVSSALAHLVSSAEHAAFQRWARPVIEATSALSTTSDRLAAVLSDLRHSVLSARAAEGEARRDLAVELQRTGNESLAQLVVGTQSMIATLNNALGADASGRIDMHRAGDIFSSSDVARETALAHINEAEEWKKDSRQLVMEAETKLQANQDDMVIHAGDTTMAIKDLDEQLEALELENVVNPSPVALRTTPKHRRLPNSRIAQKLASTFCSINQSATTIAQAKPKSPEVNRFLNKLKNAAKLVPELDGLAEVSEASAACDKAFSRLLDAVDTRVETSEAAQGEAQAAVTAFEKIAETRMSDARVAAEHKRVTHAWADLPDLRSVAENVPLPSNASNASVTGNVVSENVVTKKKPRARKMSSVMPGMRPTSMAPPPPPTSNVSEPIRSRVVSDTPTKGRLRSRASVDSVQTTPRTARPRLSAPPAPMSTSKPHGSKPFTPTVPQPFQLSSSSSSSSRLSRSTSGPVDMVTPTRSRPRLSAPAYTPTLVRSPSLQRARTARSKLDDAVAQVLDTLDVGDVTCGGSRLQFRSMSPSFQPVVNPQMSGRTSPAATGLELVGELACASAASCARARSWSASAVVGSSYPAIC